jgi:hypothetical protein
VEILEAEAAGGHAGRPARRAAAGRLLG